MYDDDGIWGHDVWKGERKALDIYLGRAFVHPSVMMRRRSLLSVGGYSIGSEIGRSEDYDLWCKFYLNGFKGYNLDEVLIDYYEARDPYAKRRYRYRICKHYLMRDWRRKLGIPKKYELYAYKPLLVGLLPPRVLMMYHNYKFSGQSSGSI